VWALLITGEGAALFQPGLATLGDYGYLAKTADLGLESRAASGVSASANKAGATGTKVSALLGPQWLRAMNEGPRGIATRASIGFAKIPQDQHA